jgi:addiction module RelE/StbE family toxin
MKLRYTRIALQHIRSIHAYVAERDPAAARRVAERIHVASERLADFPQMGRRGSERGTREWVVRGLPYVIVYQILEGGDELLVLSVMHGARKRMSPGAPRS